MPIGAGKAAEHAPEEAALLRALDSDASLVTISPELVVREGYNPRTIVLDKCAGAGESELARLAQTESLEEAFAFIPVLCAWVDVGADQTGTSVRVDRRTVDSLAQAFRKVVVYHTHIGRLGEDALYLPGYVDLIGAVLIGSGHHPDKGIEIQYRALTPIGVIAYSFQPSERAVTAIETIHRTGLAEFAGENLSMLYRGAEHEREYHEAIQDCFGGRERFIACFPVEALDFVLDFTVRPATGERADAAMSSREELR